MRPPYSLQGRIALVSAALIISALGAIGVYHPWAQPAPPILILVSLGALVGALLSTGLGYMAGRRASRSVRSVAEGAHRLAEGELEHRVSALASDETQDLAQAFNTMADALRDLVHRLSEERNKLSAVLATMADGVVVVDAEGTVLLLNQAASSLLGLLGQKAEGRRLAEMVGDYSLHQLVEGCLTSGSRRQGEVELLRPRRVLGTMATPLDEGGSPGALLTFHDLTRVRQVEATHKEFVSNVSHELRNPLASVKAMVETLEEGALAEPHVAEDFLGRIHRELDRMNRLVNDLLELSRLESGQLPLEPHLLDLRPLVEEVAGQFQERADSQGVALDAQLPDGLPQVMGDPERLRQVLVNLLDNALKFTPAQGTVVISARPSESRLLEVQVKDTGFGIAREHLPHLFERFYKVDRARREGGTGLGLAIVKQIVEAHGGQVRVESQEGVGTTFTFTLPRVA